MGETLPRHYLQGILMFCGVIVLGLSLILAFQDTNSSFVDQPEFDSFNQSYNLFNDLQEETNTLKANVEGADTDFGLFGVLNSLINSGWNSLKLLFTGLSFMNSAFIGLSTIFGLPPIVLGLATTAVSILIFFAIYSVIFQKEI